MEKIKANSHYCIHFGSVKEFYEATREDNMEQLADAIYRCVHPSKKEITETAKNSSEYLSWMKSLPDFAFLLFSPNEYHKAVEEDKKRFDAVIDDLVSSIKDLADERFNAVGFMGEPTVPLIKSDFNSKIDGSVPGLKEIIQTDDVTQKLKLDSGVDIFLEYPLSTGKNGQPFRCDVILHRRDNKGNENYVIIDLKQYTEGFTPNDLTHIQNQIHYPDHLKAEKPDANVAFYFYQHIQMYNNGYFFNLIKTMDGYEEKKDRLGVYTRAYCGNLINRLNALL